MIDIDGDDSLLENAIVQGYPEADEDIKQIRENKRGKPAESVEEFLTGLDEEDE